MPNHILLSALNKRQNRLRNNNCLPIRVMRFFPCLSILATAASALAVDVDVYFGTGGSPSKGIYRATFDTETGKLGQAELAAEIGSPGFLALHPKRTALYAVAQNNQGPCVAAYRIKNNGSIGLINTTPIGDGGGAHIAVHPSGKFLLTAQYGGGSVAVFPLHSNGKVEAQSQLIEHEGGSGVVDGRQDKPHPHWVGFSPDSRYAFVPDLGIDQIVIYKVDENSPKLTPHGHAEALPGAGPRHMRFSVDGSYIYLLNELRLSVTTFAYNSEAGTTKRLSTTKALSEVVKAKEVFNSSSEIIVHPNGRFIYSGNRGNDTVTAYRANPDTGRLKVTEVEPARGAWPRNINMDEQGRWLLAAGRHSNTVAVFEIDQDTGELAFQRAGVINVPAPICIVFNQ